MLCFLIPDPEGFRSGGNRYNARLLDALRRQGVDVYATAQAEQLPEGALVLVDTLLWDRTLPVGCRPWLIVHHLQSLHPPEGFSSAAYFRGRERDHLQRFAGFLVSSPFTAKYLKRRGVRQPCLVAEPGLDELPGQLPRRDYRRIEAIMAANLVERKGLFPFLQQLKLSAPWPRLRLRIFGESQLQPDYAEACLAQLADIEGKVQYSGSVSHQELMVQFRQANLFVSASRMETYGMAIQEAAAHGLPLLLLRGGNVANHIRLPPNGRVCNTLPELVALLKRWEDDPAELLKLAENAKYQAGAVQRSWDETAGELLRGLRPFLHDNR